MDKVLDPNNLWFRHQSPNFYSVLRPMSYHELKSSRDNDKYVEERREQEKRYHRALRSNKTMSFHYSTIVGYHKMGDVMEYPGYTYYYTLEEEDIENCLFSVVSQLNDDVPLKGRDGLLEAINLWNENQHKYQEYYDDLLEGYIYPRIEVVTQMIIPYQDFVPQIEDRTHIPLTLERLQILAGIKNDQTD